MDLYLFLKSIIRLSVPFFFVASGYFLFNKLYNSSDKQLCIKNYIKRLIIPFAFWVIIDFIPLKLIPAIINKEGIKIFIMRTIRALIFYPWGAMWYILALIITMKSNNNSRGQRT